MWIAGFNANKPTGLQVPTWVTFKTLPEEFLNVAAEIAGGLGVVLGVDKRNPHSIDQRFYIGLSSVEG